MIITSHTFNRRECVLRRSCTGSGHQLAAVLFYGAFMETDFANAKVGEKVWDILEGWGIIKDIFADGLRVQFDNHTRLYFRNGRGDIQDKNPRLFKEEATEVKIIPPPRPKRKVMKTVEVWGLFTANGKLICSSEDKYKLAFHNISGFDRTVKLTGEYEVEE